ncbi:cupin domain-containing protein [Mucilaginibacter flavus]|uniref:cupin domain-containing protein n=1 Tax=Mucilaginibacter flavus TaxID=931504 RepID=UPI0025B62984|nr:cupin domain-containing protein [Mucilaginibacter flavus]MDN3584694.1 cupin domain-containing protein [Mucilaginibacter flavus]
MENAAYWIAHLQLLPHPEGGYYKEVFRSAQSINRQQQPAVVKQACTSIYYLLEGKDFSTFHRLASDEIWYFHKGDPLLIYAINNDGELTTHELSDTSTGSLSIVIEPGIWFAAETKAEDGFSLVSCAVAPGFDFNEFEMAGKENMLSLCPKHQELIARLCRE